jgi:glycosyltransferase involved in cell wall biosynthesis
VDRFRPDVVHVHNLHGARFTIRLLERLRGRGYPVAWTLHDMWAFTGGCVYAYDCALFHGAGCDHTCPIPDRYPFLEPSRIRTDFEARRAFYRGLGRDVVIVTPSRWLAGEAARGILSGNRIEVIPNGFDLETFKPLPADVARRALELPDDLPILLTGAQNLDDPRKGAAYLREAVDLLAARRKVRLVTYGIGGALQANVPATPLGTVGDERLMRLCYAAADLFVLPTLADNLPNVLVEAAACGTPAVAFDVGGRTGSLARCGDARDLAARIERVLALEPDARAKMRSACREWALQSYDHHAQGRAYLRLFNSMVGGA